MLFKKYNSGIFTKGLALAIAVITSLSATGCGNADANMGTPTVTINEQKYVYSGKSNEFTPLSELPTGYEQIDKEKDKTEFSYHINDKSTVWAEADNDYSIYLYASDFLGEKGSKYHLFIKAGLPNKFVKLDTELYADKSAEVQDNPDLKDYKLIGKISSYDSAHIPQTSLTSNSQELLDKEVYYNETNDDLYVKISSQDNKEQYIHMENYKEQ